MEFFKKSKVEIHKNRNGNLYFLPAFAVFLGAVIYLILIGNNVFIFNCNSGNVYVYVCCCVAALLLIFLSGLCVAGHFMIFCFDFLLGFFASACVNGVISEGDVFSLAWFFWAFYIFALIFCTLLISSFSRKFSTELFCKVKGDVKFRTKLIEFSAVCLFFILMIISVFFAVYKLKPEFFV